MRLSTDSDRSDERARATILAAIEAGVNLLDTAPSYGLGEDDAHHSERVIGRVLSDLGPRADSITVVTKGGLHRQGTAWVPDGRGKTLRASCEASLEALGRPIDLFLLHAPDPATPLRTSARALARLASEGLVRSVGLSNISLAALESVSGEMDVAAIEIALGVFDDGPLRSGLVQRCVERGIRVLAHSPLGGPKRVGRLARESVLRKLAEKHATTPGTVALAWLYGLSDSIVPLPGARRETTARLATAAATLLLDASDRAALDERFPAAARVFRPRVRARSEASDREVVVVMGIQAAGKSRFVEKLVADGYERLNRDERGGTMRGLHLALDEKLRDGGTRFVLDNTYPTRAVRSEVVEIAERHGARARVLFLDTPLESAQAHAVERLVDRYGRLPDPSELRALSRKDPHAFGPNAQHRFRRELERPTADEGWDAIETIAYERAPSSGSHARGLVFAAELLRLSDASRARGLLRELVAEQSDGPILAFAFADGPVAAKLEQSCRAFADSVSANVIFAACPHGGGPPICWCRPPLPGLIVPWMRAHRVDARSSTLLGTAPQHRAMARGLGLIFREPGA